MSTNLKKKKLQRNNKLSFVRNPNFECNRFIITTLKTAIASPVLFFSFFPFGIDVQSMMYTENSVQYQKLFAVIRRRLEAYNVNILRLRPPPSGRLVSTRFGATPGGGERANNGCVTSSVVICRVRRT